MKIAVDVMSGERSPEILIAGAMDALTLTKADLILVGDKDIINDSLSHFTYNENRLEVVHSSEVITMKESPTTAIKEKPDASVIVSAKLVKQGIADGFISPGNTGATFAAAFMNLGRLKGVSRPAILNILPTKIVDQYVVFLDGGANPECKASNLVQFAVMGSIYASKILGRKNPRVGLISNGVEESKGTEITRKASQLLKKLPLNYTGYAEGRDLFNNSIDVGICDGFTGNIVLKTVEGVGMALYDILKSEIEKNVIYKGLALLMAKAFKSMKKRTDYEEYGGAPLIGINGTCIILHGGSSGKAVMNGIKVAADYIENGVNDEIVSELKEFGVNKLNILHWD